MIKSKFRGYVGLAFGINMGSPKNPIQMIVSQLIGSTVDT